MKATKTIIIAILLTTGLLMGCGDSRTDLMLSSIDTLMNNHPDSAFYMLDSLKAEKPHWPKSQRMRYDLLHLKAENKADVLLKNSDSIAKQLVNYYKRWGSANEKMLAYYLLGRCYSDMGDSPRAIDTYQNAISQADTTAKDCDYLTLSCVYSQMAGMYHKQLLFINEIKACNQASYYAYLAKDTLKAIINIGKSATAQILLNKRENAETCLKEARKLFFQHNYVQEALQSSTVLMYIYVQDPQKLIEAKQLIDEYESESKLFNENHELPSSKRIYYYYKGLYFEGINKLDSAEYYYRKIYYFNMPFTAQNSMYGGLLNVYTKRHQADSISKYAKLYCEANDSSIARKDQELTAQMAATYDYSLYQKEALENESKAHRAQLMIIIIIIVTLITVIILYYFWREHQKKQKEEQLRKQREINDLRERYASAADEYTNNLYTLQLLDNAHKETIAIIQQELERTKDENETYRLKLSEINTEFENCRHELIKENEALQLKIEELKRQEGISQQLTNSCKFADTDIMKRVSYLTEHPLESMSEDELELLVKTASTYYPILLHDLTNSPNISKKEIQACILISQALRESDIAHILNTSAQRVTNIKSTLNKDLFHQSSARSLYKNLVKRYEIYVL